MPTPLVFGYSILKVPDDAIQLADVLGCDVPDALAIAGRSVRLLSVAGWDESNEPEFVLVEFLDDASKIEIPLEVLDFVDTLDHQQGGAEEAEAENESLEDHEILVVRDRESEKQMIRSLAAESIQEAYKRYIECKPAMRAKRFSKSQQLVLALASDTIKTGIRKSLTEKRTRAIRASSPAPHSENMGQSQAVSMETFVENPPQIAEKHQQDWESSMELPAGYERRFDETKKRTYYVNHVDKTTSWRHPRADGDKESAPRAASVPIPSSAYSFPPLTAATTKPAAEMAPASTRRKGSKSSLASAAALRSLSPMRTDIPVASVTVAATAPPTSASAPKPAPPPPPKLLMIDVAFSRAYKQECAEIVFQTQEVVILLDALDVALQTDYQLRLDSTETVRLPALHSAAFASTLTHVAKSMTGVIQNPQGLEISEDKAETGIRRIRSLVEGPWQRKARSTLLHLCSGKHGKQARPSFWPSDHLKTLFVSTLGFPEEYFGALSGSELIALDVCRLRADFGVGPSLMLARFAVYQHAIRLLEQWWEQGHRPADEIKASLVSEMLPYLAPDAGRGAAPTLAPAPAPVFTDAVNVIGAANPQLPSLSALKVKAKKGGKNRKDKWRGAQPQYDVAMLPTSPKRWGFVGDLSVRKMRSSGGATLVEVAPAEALLQAWAPLSRAYGWGVPLDALTGLGMRIGNSVGSLAPNVREVGPQGAPLECVNGSCWVIFAPSHSAVSTLPTSSSTSSSLASPIEAFSSLPIVRRVVGIEAAADAPSTFYAVLVPLQCLRGAADTPVKDLPYGGVLLAADVSIGKHLRVVDAEALCRACERFEWWDRPPPEALAAMAGQRCEIVSLAELQSAHRVGIRMVDSGALDGVPLEALLPEAPLKTRPKPRMRSVSGSGPGRRAAQQAWGDNQSTPTLITGLAAESAVEKETVPAPLSAAPSVRLDADEDSTAKVSAPLFVVTISSNPDAIPVSAVPPVTALIPEIDSGRPISNSVGTKTKPKPRAGPSIPVRERGHGAARFRGPSSTEIVEAFYRRALETPLKKPEGEFVGEGVSAPSSKVHHEPQPETTTEQQLAPDPSPGAQSAGISNTRPPLWMQRSSLNSRVVPTPEPVPANPRPVSAVLRLSVAEFDADHAVFDIPVPISSALHGGRGGKKKKQTATRVASSPSPDPDQGQGALRRVDIEFDTGNAVFDIDPVMAHPRGGARDRALSPGGEAKLAKDKEGEGEGELLIADVAIEPWEGDGGEFMISGLHYHKVQKALTSAPRLRDVRAESGEQVDITTPPEITGGDEKASTLLPLEEVMDDPDAAAQESENIGNENVRSSLV